MGEADFNRLGDVLEAGRELPPPPAPTWTPGTDTAPAKVRGIPPGRLADTFDTFELARNPSMREALEACRTVARGERWCALLIGGYGTGKTHLQIAALNSWRQEHDSGYFWNVPDFLDWLRGRVFGDGAELPDVIRPYREGRFLLALDDLGTENRTEWAYEQLYRVLNDRSNNRLPTIITSNAELADLDGRILSRYREGFIVCRGRDLRAPQLAAV